MWKEDEYLALEITFFSSPEDGKGSYHPYVLGGHDSALQILYLSFRPQLSQFQEGC